MYKLMRNVMTPNEVGKGELCETNVIFIPSPGLGRLRVGGLASQLDKGKKNVSGQLVVVF